MAYLKYKPAFILAVILVASVVSAGDLEVLPTTDKSFQMKIEAFIKPGNRLEVALRLLEADRFECREFRNKYPVFHCSRTDTPAKGSDARYYQVMIEPRGESVKTVTPSLGVIRR